MSSTTSSSYYSLFNSTSRRASSQSESIPRSNPTSQQDQAKELVFMSQIDCKINVFRDHPNRYLDAYVPSRVETSSCTVPHRGTFDYTWAPEDDAGLCTRLVLGLEKLVAQFHDTKCLSFVINRNDSIKLPYKMCDDEQHRSTPTVIVSLPGQEASSLSSPDWRNISLAFDVMPRDEDDPVGKLSLEHEETLVRLSKHARNILIAQSRLFVFVVGIYGSVARIFRFDHSAAIVSEPFNYVDEPSIMQRFLQRFVNPCMDANTVVGADPTVRVPDDADIQWAEDLLMKSGKGPLTPEERRVCRWMAIDDPAGRSVTCFAFRLQYINPRLFSRASMVWEALQEGSTDGTTIIVKDSWRLLSHASELDFYATLRTGLHESIPELDEEHSDLLDESALHFGVAQFLVGVDFGEVETNRRLSCKSSSDVQSDASPLDIKCPDPSASGCSHIQHPDDEQSLPLPVCHQTLSARLRGPPSTTNHERSHTRLALKTVGRPISRFKSTRELVEALRDAIKGHRAAYKAGVLHQDISEGNVMIAEDAPFKGFIGDFDYSFNWKHFLQANNLEISRDCWEAYVVRTYCAENGERSRSDWSSSEDATRIVTPVVEKKPKAQTGTLYFMAIEILEGTAMHEARHDLESFYWLLVWLVLRHTEHDHPEGRIAGTTFFTPKYEDECSGQKRSWLWPYRQVTVPSNPPLSFLLREFRELCSSNCRMGRSPVVPLTYEAVLAKFDEALACKDWPVDDPAIPQPVARPRATSNKRPDEKISSAGGQDRPGWPGLIKIPPLPHRQAENLKRFLAMQVALRDAPCVDARNEILRAALIGNNTAGAPRSRSSSKRTRVDPDEETSPSKRARRATGRGKGSLNAV